MTASKTLKDGALSFIDKNFVVVTKSADFVNLSVEEVTDLISSDDIEVKGVEHCPEIRKAVCTSCLDMCALLW